MQRNAPASSPRVWFMDCVRYWSVLAVVLLHVGMSQMTIPWGWAVDDPRQLAPATWLVLLTASFVMPVLFFVAGYFALPSLESTEAVAFIKGKVKRLLLPGMLVVVFLNPLFVYVYHYTRGFDGAVPRMGYGEFWGRFFEDATVSAVWEPATPWVRQYTLLHIWFVTVLFVFFVVTGLLRAALGPRHPAQGKTASDASIVTTIAGASALGWCSMSIMNVFTVANAWVCVGPVLVFQIPHIWLYVCYYCLGLIAYHRNWFAQTRFVGQLRYWCVAGALLLVADVRLANISSADPDLGATLPFQALTNAVVIALCVAMLVTLMGVAQRYCNRRSALHQHLAAHSYAVYLVHMAVVVLVQWGLWYASGLSGAAVLLIGCVASVALCYLAARGWLAAVGWCERWLAQRAVAREADGALAAQEAIEAPPA